MRVWLPMRRVCLFVLGGCERVWVRSLAFSRDGLVLASTAEGDMVKQTHTHSHTGCVAMLDTHVFVH